MATRKQSRSQQLADSHNAVPGLSQEEVKKLFHVFDSEGERDIIVASHKTKSCNFARPGQPCVMLGQT